MANPIPKVILKSMRQLEFISDRGVLTFAVLCLLMVAATAEEDAARSSCSWQPHGDCLPIISQNAESLLQVRKSEPFVGAAANPSIAELTRDLTATELEELTAKLYAKPAESAEPAAIAELVAPSLSLASSGSMISGTIAGQETGLGAHVPLSEAGYLTVLKESSNGEMETFLRRALEDLGLELLDPDGLSKVIPWYSGEEASASFGEFKGKILNSLGRDGAFVAEAAQKRSIGKDALVTNEGYLQVAELKNNEEMANFIEKVVKDMGFTIVNPGGIHGLAPFYSGEQQVQNLSSLKLEILRAALTPGSWVQANKNSK